jgi:hypothetical protein
MVLKTSTVSQKSKSPPEFSTSSGIVVERRLSRRLGVFGLCGAEPRPPGLFLLSTILRSSSFSPAA